MHDHGVPDDDPARRRAAPRKRIATDHPRTRWLVAVGSVLAGFVIPFFVVAVVVGWAVPQPHGDDMAEGLYEAFLGFIAGLLGMIIASIVSMLWLRGSVQRFAFWMTTAGITGPVVLGISLSFLR